MAKTSKYRVVERSIKESISNGLLAAGDQLKTEEELCSEFGFSRTTIGKALDNLRAAGYIERIPGKGTFVRSTHIEKHAGSCTSFSEDMAEIGLQAGAKLISYEVLRASDVPDIARKLNVSPDELIHHFVRLRTGDERPIAIGYTYVAGSVIPAIDIKSLDHSFYAYVRSLGFEILSADVHYNAVLPTEEQSRLLEASDIALLRSTHVSYVKRDGIVTPFEYTETCYNGTMYSYTAHAPRTDGHLDL